MKMVVAKLDDETFRQLEMVARGEVRSDAIRSAIKEYIAARKIEARKNEVQDYIRSSEERETMRRLAETDMDHAAELLDREETRQ